MLTQYSPEYPLGFNRNMFSPEIDRYLSWPELVEIVRTNVFKSDNGNEYELPTLKEDKPLFTFKGDYGDRRCNSNFQGNRSPYIGIDIDIAEKESGINKKQLSEEQRRKVKDDIEIIINVLSGFKKNYFFCKRTSSGCGLHIILKITEIPDGSTELYEKHIFNLFQYRLNDICPSLNYRYNVDHAMLALSQSLIINHDPDVIFNPDESRPASFYKLSTEFGEGKVGEGERVFPIREANQVDQIMFRRFERFIAENKIRMEYTDIMRLAIIFFLIWPEGSLNDFYANCSGFNTERSKERGSNQKFLKGLYDSVKKNARKHYKGKRLSVGSLYFLMNEYFYKYSPDATIHFNGYLASIEDQLFNQFELKDKILLEAPTGSGKTKTMFKHLKKLAAENPTKQFVIALPYTGMAEQFAVENRDEDFQIKVHHGTNRNYFAAYKQLPKKKQKKKKNVTVSTPVVDQPIIHNNIWCTTYDSAYQIRNIHTLIVDEAHDTVKQVEFRSEALESLETIDCKKKIFITATPDALLPEAEDFFHIKCVKDDAVKPRLSVVNVKGSVTEALKEEIKQTPTSLSFYNHKPRCLKVQTDLASEGIKVGLYNSDTKREEHQLVMQSTGMLMERSLATSYLLEGFNVLNDNVGRINIANEYDIDNVRQGAARPRKCNPEIILLLKHTEYEPGGSWKFNRAYEYAKKLSAIEKIVSELNNHSMANGIYFKNGNLFKAYEGEMLFILKSDVPEPMFPNPRDERRHRRYFHVNEAAVKNSINERYRHWLYHKQRSSWYFELEKYFTIGETREVDNTADEPKRIKADFEAFKNAREELIMKFYDHQIAKYKPKYDDEMRAFAAQYNNIQFTSYWENWTKRYLKMKEYGPVDYKIIESGSSFSYWQREADMSVSINEGATTPKELRIALRNKAAFDFILNTDYSKELITTTELFKRMNKYLSENKFDKFLKQKSFFAAIKSVLEITRTQRGANRTRYIKSVADISKATEFKTADQRRREKDSDKPNEYAGL